MAASLAERAAEDELHNVSAEVSDLREFRLPSASVDLVVSSYALHHLSHQSYPNRPDRGLCSLWTAPGRPRLHVLFIHANSLESNGPVSEPQ